LVLFSSKNLLLLTCAAYIQVNSQKNIVENKISSG